MAFQIVWAKCNVFDQDGNRHEFQRGELVPDGLVNPDRDQLDRLVTVGAVQVVDLPEPAPEAPESNATGTTDDTGTDDTGELVKPAEDENKDAWISYATDARNPDRISASDARSMSKPALIDRYRES